MDPLYCSESLDRIPLEMFKQGQAAFSGGRPYLVAHAERLGLKLDVKPPPEYAAALGFATLNDVGVNTIMPSGRAMPTRKIEKRPAKPRRKTVVTEKRCVLKIIQMPDGPGEVHPPVRIDLQRHAFKNNALVLGRDTRDTRIFSANARISRRHCQMWLADGKVYVQDLASSNKTFIDGVPLIPDVPFPFFLSQVLTMGAKHSAIKITLDATGYPFMEKPISADAGLLDSRALGTSDSSHYDPPSTEQSDSAKRPGITHGESTQAT